MSTVVLRVKPTSVKCIKNKKEKILRFYVAKTGIAVLGKKACEQLGLVKRVDNSSQPAIEGYCVTMVQIFVTSNLSIQICSIDTRDER